MSKQNKKIEQAYGKLLAPVKTRFIHQDAVSLLIKKKSK